MDWLIIILPMIVDQFKAAGQDVRHMPAPAFSTSAKIKPGMTIAELINQVGMPKEIEPSIAADHMLVYRGDLCTKAEENCYIFEKAGKVEMMMRIKPQYMAGI